MAEVTGTARVKRGMAEMLKGGVIMDVVNAEQAKIAEDAGAVAVMALERVPADIRAQGGVARMSDPDMIEKIQAAVSIPVMAKARIGHFVEAQVLQTLNVDYIDESEVLTPSDYENHIDKWAFTVPFVCGATIVHQEILPKLTYRTGIDIHFLFAVLVRSLVIHTDILCVNISNRESLAIRKECSVTIVLGFLCNYRHTHINIHIL